MFFTETCNLERSGMKERRERQAKRCAYFSRSQCNETPSNFLRELYG